jgi:hypothetical protein
MAGGSKGVAAAAVLVLVVMAMVAEYSSVEAVGVCNPNALYACMSAVQGTRPPAPSQQCCNVVRSVDKNCMCNQLKSASFPAQMVNNGLQLPKKCGRTDLRGFKCGRECAHSVPSILNISTHSLRLACSHDSILVQSSHLPTQMLTF